MELIIYRKGEPFTVLYDDCDHELISGYKWMISTAGYVIAHRKGKCVFMHRLIVKTPDGLFTDHKNRVKHDNRRQNLRLCTKEQNVRNRKNNPNSKCQGAYKLARSGKFVAQIRANGKTLVLGRFDLEEEALRAYDSAANFYFGEFALLNFPCEQPNEFIEPTQKGRVKKDFLGVDALSSILKEKNILKSRLLPIEITKAAYKIGKPPHYVSSWFSLDRLDKRDQQYKDAIEEVISERNEMYRKLIQKAIAA